MSDDEIRKEVLRFLRSNSPSSTRAVRAGVKARAARVDEGLRALLTEGRVDRSNDVWFAVRRDGTRWGHATNGGRSPGGAQVSYRKVVALLAEREYREGYALNRPHAIERAEALVKPLLPEKQRKRLGS